MDVRIPFRMTFAADSHQGSFSDPLSPSRRGNPGTAETVSLILDYYSPQGYPLQIREPGGADLFFSS